MQFGPGISVVVGPNGSGKSNITDAILWAMGEQSALAVRGSSMQDVIFGGGPGVQARSAAEVELVLDNGDGTIDMPEAEISIVRRVERSGDGEYRLGGARCRLADVLEVLSDTGLGRETHSIVSQGRIESIVTSKPRDRRMLLEEAAGLGKHRKRRRRAQLKLARTQLNVDRALDVEREARARLRPLARHAQAAELHARLEHQMLEARLELARHHWVTGTADYDRDLTAAREAREARVAVEAQLGEVMATRATAERGLTERAEQHDALSERLYGARSARERLGLRADQMRTLRAALSERVAGAEADLAALQAQSADDGAAEAAESAERRVAELEAALAKAHASLLADSSERSNMLGRQLTERRQELDVLRRDLEQARARQQRAAERTAAERLGSSWQASWSEVRKLIVDGVRRAAALASDSERQHAAAEIADSAERVARAAVEQALGQVVTATHAESDPAGDGDGEATAAVAALQRRVDDATAAEQRVAWLIEQRDGAPEQGPLAVRCAELQGELAAERRLLERVVSEHGQRDERVATLRARNAEDTSVIAAIERLIAVLEPLGAVTTERIAALEAEIARDRGAGDQIAAVLSACAQQEAEIQARLRQLGERVTEAEVASQRSCDRLADTVAELDEVVRRLECDAELARPADAQPLSDEQIEALQARIARLSRRREQLGPVNPLAQREYADAQAHVAELAAGREDLEAALRELRLVIRRTDKHIRETFQATFDSVAANFAEVIQEVFPGGSGRLRLVEEQPALRPVLGDGATPAELSGDGQSSESDQHSEGGEDEWTEDDDGSGTPPEQLLGVEIEVTPAGKSARRLSLLSGGEKSMTALAFLFALFLAHPAPFYVLDEVEAALDDLNLERFLALLRRCADRAQFIVITHQKRTMDAASWLYGVSMGADGVSRVLSRRLGPPDVQAVPTDGPELEAVASL
jgi:chromosome segregation protein